jgi:very-short-patch-repair endonuclease
VGAKTPRKRLTDAERLLWTYLRAKQLKGLKFRRQESIGKYIADFACHEKRIVIEVDGGQHPTNKERDRERDNWFKEQGYKVLRFTLPLIPSHQGWSWYTLDTGGAITVLNYMIFFTSLDSGFRRNDNFAYFSVIPAKAGIP